jgi:hypothetical protein
MLSSLLLRFLENASSPLTAGRESFKNIIFHYSASGTEGVIVLTSTFLQQHCGNRCCLTSAAGAISSQLICRPRLGNFCSRFLQQPFTWQQFHRSGQRYHRPSVPCPPPVFQQSDFGIDLESGFSLSSSAMISSRSPIHHPSSTISQ